MKILEPIWRKKRTQNEPKILQCQGCQQKSYHWSPRMVAVTQSPVTAGRGQSRLVAPGRGVLRKKRLFIFYAPPPKPKNLTQLQQRYSIPDGALDLLWGLVVAPKAFGVGAFALAAVTQSPLPASPEFAIA